MNADAFFSNSESYAAPFGMEPEIPDGMEFASFKTVIRGHIHPEAPMAHRDGLTRREFIRDAARAGAGAATVGAFAGRAWGAEPRPRLAVVRKGAPADMARKAIEALGGMKTFVKRGDVVVVKPNMAWERRPEYAVNTNPEVVGAVVRLCLEAGAKKVRVFERTVNKADRCADMSGIRKAVEDAGGEFSFVNDARFVKKAVGGQVLKEWDVYRDALEADCLINIPIAKHHGLAGLTLCFKNWMGVLGGNRGQLHGKELPARLADVGGLFRVQSRVSIVDATRILLRNGPSGGNLDDVKETKTLIASADPVACEAWAASLFGKKPEDVGTTVAGSRLGLGTLDLGQVDVQTIEMGT